MCALVFHIKFRFTKKMLPQRNDTSKAVTEHCTSGEQAGWRSKSAAQLLRATALWRKQLGRHGWTFWRN